MKLQEKAEGLGHSKKPVRFYVNNKVSDNHRRDHSYKKINETLKRQQRTYMCLIVLFTWGRYMITSLDEFSEDA